MYTDTFTEYEKATEEMALPPSPLMPPIVLFALKLNGEAGEIAEKVGKIYRDKHGVFSDEDKRAIALECGDCLWYLARIAACVGYTLCKVATMNVLKLLDRKKRGVQGGSGDNR